MNTDQCNDLSVSRETRNAM